MLTTHHGSYESQPDNNATKTNIRLLVALALLLTTIAVMLISSALVSNGPGEQVALAKDFETTASPSPTPNECLTNVAWPAGFSVPFTAYVYTGKSGHRNNFVPWSGNTLYYQYDAGTDTVYFKASFKKCLNLPGVPLSFFGQPCEFYFPRDPKTNQYYSYVYSSFRNKFFVLAENFGPMPQDFVAGYQKLLPSCLSKPHDLSPLAVRNPPGVAVDWFVTSGHKGEKINNPLHMGYYAAIADPVTAGDGTVYKPPYSFAGSVPGVHEPCKMRLAPGQLVYDYQNISVQQIPNDFFNLPKTLNKIDGVKWELPPMNCPACHLTDGTSRTTFYTEARRNPPACPTPTPTPAPR
jgi:hypothetical protein